MRTTIDRFIEVMQMQYTNPNIGREVIIPPYSTLIEHSERFNMDIDYKDKRDFDLVANKVGKIFSVIPLDEGITYEIEVLTNSGFTSILLNESYINFK